MVVKRVDDGDTVDPSAEVKELITDWEDPEGTIHPAGTKLELDAETAAELEQLGLLGPTAI
ncbi:hypothetical protein [Virgisporangium aliadipatigenens]|jgi:hypothetical protein|nr:hypothetical protein [Virgisporangium aliadipatigenens]